MEFSKEGRFFPNECYICKQRKNLLRCKCKMISYCGENHQNQHWPIHQDFCNTIMSYLKEKNLSHIYEKLVDKFGSQWVRKRNKIRKELVEKLGRKMSPQENAIFIRPRICFYCSKTEQEELNDCPGCPVVSFCKICEESDIIHKENCFAMKRYLNMLNKAEELKIDLKFLPEVFPFVREKMEIEFDDPLTNTILLEEEDLSFDDSRVMKNSLCDFLNIAAKFHIALKKIDNLPSELLIHIDGLNSKCAITKENYWEFLLHFNSNIKTLKIVVTGSENLDVNSSLCEKCFSEGKNLIVEIRSIAYEEYTKEKCYEEPNVMFYCRGVNEKYFEKIKCPVILSTVSLQNFNETKTILEFFTDFQIIYEGQIYSLFVDQTLTENKYFLIFKARKNHGEITEFSLIENDLKTLSSTIESRFKEIENQIKEILNKLKEIENKLNETISISVTGKLEEESKISENSSKHFDEEQETEVEPIASSSLVIIPEIDLGRKNLFSSAEKKENEENDDKTNLFSFNVENFDGGEINFSQLFLVKHISFLQNENERLRAQLTSSVEAVTKLEEKNVQLREICLDLVEKNKLIKEVTSDIVVDVDKKIFEI